MVRAALLVRTPADSVSIAGDMPRAALIASSRVSGAASWALAAPIDKIAAITTARIRGIRRHLKAIAITTWSKHTVCTPEVVTRWGASASVCRYKDFSGNPTAEQEYNGRTYL